MKEGISRGGVSRVGVARCFDRMHWYEGVLGGSGVSIEIVRIYHEEWYFEGLVEWRVPIGNEFHDTIDRYNHCCHRDPTNYQQQTESQTKHKK